jgi:hypothetical protein
MNVEHFRCPLDSCDYWRVVNRDVPDAAEILADEDTALHEHFETHSTAEVLAAMREMVRERTGLRRLADKVRPER